MGSRRQLNRGFSIVELLVVIGIIGVLIAITLPALVGVKQSGGEVQSLANLHSIGQVLTQYHAAYSDEYPFYVPNDDPIFYYPKDSTRTSDGSFLPVWLLRTNWPLIGRIHDIAPWPEHYETWVSPGSEKSGEAAWWLIAAPDGVFNYRPPSYEYSNSFVGDWRAWGEGEPMSDSEKRVHAADVRFPAAKVVMNDAARAYLRPRPTPADARPVLFADTSASLRSDADATPPVQNRGWGGAPLLYNDTPLGVHGRDFN